MDTQMRFPLLMDPSTYPMDIRTRTEYDEGRKTDRRIFTEMQAEGKLAGAQYHPFPYTASVEMEYWAQCYVERDEPCHACGKRIRKNAARIHYQWPSQYAILCLECGVAHGWFGFFNARQSYWIEDQGGVLAITHTRPLTVFTGHQPIPVTPHRQPLRAYRAAKRRITRRAVQECAA